MRKRSPKQSPSFPENWSEEQIAFFKLSMDVGTGFGTLLTRCNDETGVPICTHPKREIHAIEKLELAGCALSNVPKDQRIVKALTSKPLVKRYHKLFSRLEEFSRGYYVCITYEAYIPVLLEICNINDHQTCPNCSVIRTFRLGSRKGSSSVGGV